MNQRDKVLGQAMTHMDSLEYDSAYYKLRSLYGQGYGDTAVTCRIADALDSLDSYPLFNTTLFFCARCVESDPNRCDQVRPYVESIGAEILTCHDIDSAAASLTILSDSCSNDGCIDLMAEAAELLRYVNGATAAFDHEETESKLENLRNVMSGCQNDDLRAKVLATTAIQLTKSNYKKGPDLALKVLRSAIEKDIVEDTVCRTYARACFRKTREATTPEQIFDEAKRGLKLEAKCGKCKVESCEAILCSEALSAGRRLIESGSPGWALDWADSIAFEVNACCLEAMELFKDAVVSLSAALAETDSPSKELIEELETRTRRIATECGTEVPNIRELLDKDFANKHARSLLRQADSLWHFGSSESVVEVLQRAETYAPDMDSILMKLGIAMIEEGKCDTIKLQEVAENTEDSAMLWRAEGFLAYATQDYSEAVTKFQGAIKLSQSDYESWYGKGLAYLAMASAELGARHCGTAMQHFDQGLDDLEEANRLFARHSPWRKGGDHLQQSRRFIRSIETSEALKDTSLVRCNVYVTVDHYKNVIDSGDQDSIRQIVLPALFECRDSFRPLILRKTDSSLYSGIMFNIGLCYEHLMAFVHPLAFDSAMAYYKKTIDYDSSWHAGYGGIGSLHFGRQKWDLCVANLEKSEERGGRDDWLWKKLGIAHCKNGNGAMARIYLHRIGNPDKRTQLADELEIGCGVH